MPRSSASREAGKWQWAAVGVGVVINLTILIIAAVNQRLKYVSYGVDCSRPADWLKVHLYLAVVSIGVLLDAGWKLRKTRIADENAPPGSPANKDAMLGGPFYRLLMYDYVLYIYSLLAVFMIVWNFIPADGPWIVGSEGHPIEACESINHAVALVRALVWIYQAMMLAAFFVSVCWVPGMAPVVKKKPRRQSSTAAYEQELVAVEMAE